MVVALVNLVSALTPSLTSRLAATRQAFPISVINASPTVLAILSIMLLVTSRGLRRGQHSAFFCVTILISASIVLNIAKGLDIEEAAISAVFLLFLARHRSSFPARSGTYSAGLACQASLAVVAVVTINTSLTVVTGVSLFAVANLSIATTWLFIRSRHDRTRVSGVDQGDFLRAKMIVAAWNQDTLGYFTLRDDKQYRFIHNSVVAFTIKNGCCLISPDPIGPPNERDQVWANALRWIEENGWTVAVLGAHKDWLPIYAQHGMKSMYIGDEAIVCCDDFSLDGGSMKGLRQAHARIRKAGVTIEFHDPNFVEPALQNQVLGMMGESRKAGVERGFSMTLGRVFDKRDEGLLMAIARDQSGDVVAICQFTPSPGIQGWSLDLMRRKVATSLPNGVTDFVIVETMRHLADEGFKNLCLNFAVMRSMFEPQTSQGLRRRVVRHSLIQLSKRAQIESLWKYNRKFAPQWQPRYLVFDAVSHLVSQAMSIAEVESFIEIPLVGRVVRAKSITTSS